MDKYEYKVRADEIKALIAEGEYAEAVKIADTVDWRRVRSVMMLCTISDLYKINRRLQESKDILLLAYEKHPTGRLIVYSLCELSIKMEEYVQAIEYYKEFVQIAPKDTGRYVLQYRLYEAQDVSLEERIAVLEEFKKREPREKWVYELAYLYHRVGLTTKCVEECDEMFLWFGEGRYVIKALELKALHQPLSEEQQKKYDLWIAGRKAGELEEEEEEFREEEYEISGDTQTAEEIRHGAEPADEEEQEIMTAPTTELPEVKPVDVGQYNTINLQMALAESMKEVLADEDEPDADMSEELDEYEGLDADEPGELDEYDEPDTDGPGELDEYEEPDADGPGEPDEFDEPDEDDEFMEDEPELEEESPSITEAIIAPLLQETTELPAVEPEEEPEDDEEEERVPGDTLVFDAQQIIEQMKKEAERLQQAALQAQAANKRASGQIPGATTGVLTPLNTKPTEYDKILSQEYDGQIKLVMPESEQMEKQITGQLSIDDIMAEWEQVKKTNEEKRMEDVRQHIMAQTGSLFANFDEATKNGLLEELEKAFMAAIMKESGKKPKVKKVILPEDEEESAPEEERPAEKAKPEKNRKSDTEEPEKGGESGTEDEPEENSSEENGESSGAAGSRYSGRKKRQAEEPAEEPVTNSRELTTEEQELFGQFVHHRKSRRQLVNTLDNMSLASCTGNVLITGEEHDMALDLAKALIREMQYSDGNFSGKVAKIEGPVLNKKDVEATFGRLDNGALIIVKPSKLKAETVSKMVRFLEKDNMGLLVLMVDTKQNINQLLADNRALSNNFNLRVDIEPLDDEALVAYAKQYAEEMEYAIDEFGILALHTRIADRQTSDHEVSLAEVRELVDEAISYANKKTPGHFMDVLLAKRYDEEDMIILREKDFMHY